MTEPLVVDVREPYRRRGAESSLVVHVPLGILLGDPERLPNDRPILVLGTDLRQSQFAARFLREHGRQAFPVQSDADEF